MKMNDDESSLGNVTRWDIYRIKMQQFYLTIRK